jgi:GrpB-like predicted nucleotidyltransferase (UPF0157 family)
VGLKRGTVRLRPYDAAWTALADEDMVELRRVLRGPPFDIQHVGSTAVLDLASKPIIDIAVGLAEPIDEGEIVRQLCASGYVFADDRASYTAAEHHFIQRVLSVE